MPEVTVVVPTYNRRAWLGRCLDALGRLPEQPAVVVVDNGSKDGSAGLVAKDFPQARLLRRNNGPMMEARNVGVAAAATPIVALTDVDTGWKSGALERAAATMREYRRLAVIAPQTLAGSRRQPDPMSAFLASASRGMEEDLPGPSVHGFRPGAAVLRREAFLAVGGFDPAAFDPGPDRRLASDLARAGWGLAYCDDVVATSDRGRQVNRRKLEVVVRKTSKVRTAWPQ
jgi:GT2 family glycosyltransferase